MPGHGWLADATLIGAFAAALVVPPAAGQALGGVRGPLAALVIATLAVAYGRAVRRWLWPASDAVQIDAVQIALFEVVAGFAAVSLVHLAATTAVGAGALVALALDVGVAIALLVRAPAPAAGGPAPASRLSSAAAPAVVLLACAVLAAFWSRESLAAVADARQSGLFDAWRDFLLHASEITYLRDYPAFGTESQYLAGLSQPLYHRASYAMPALYSALAGVPSLEVATAVWMPVGLLLCAVAVYVFGSALGGAPSGAAAVTAVFLLPDASTYGFQNRYLSFHWLLQIAGGSGYAIAVTLMALTVVVTSGPRSRLRALVRAGALAAAAAAFRVHIALVGVLAVAILALTAWPQMSRRQRAAGGLAVGVLAAAAASMNWGQLAPGVAPAGANPVAFVETVHRQAERPWGVYTQLTRGRGDAWKFAAGYALVLPSALGLLLPGLAAVWLVVPGRMRWRAGAIPVALVLSHVAVILLVPTPAHGDVTEAGHRPFVLIYAVIAALVGAAVARLLTERPARRAGIALLWALGLAGCAVPYLIGPGVQRRWAPQAAAVPISADTFGAGAFLRARSARGERVLAASEDPLAVHVALTERGAHLSRTGLYRRLKGRAASMAAARSSAHAALGAAPTFERLRTFGRGAAIAWYIADTPGTRRWPAALRSRCSYCSETIQVYDLR